jgi:hypothetical protein
VPTNQLETVKKLCSSNAEFTALPDIETPDFYHPYKRGAYRFRFASTDDDMELHVVADAALQLRLTPYSTHAPIVPSTLGDLCGGTEDDVLGKLKFPTLPNYVNAWLKLASQEHIVSTGEELVYLMNAERLIDANRVINLAWCHEYIRSETSFLLAAGLLQDQQLRINQSA